MARRWVVLLLDRLEEGVRELEQAKCADSMRRGVDSAVEAGLLIAVYLLQSGGIWLVLRQSTGA